MIWNLISPEELAAIFNIGVSLANIQTVNLERRMDDIRAGSSGFSASRFLRSDTRGPDFQCRALRDRPGQKARAARL